jgi:alginate O-acetyltransferase complex protein AlgI
MLFTDILFLFYFLPVTLFIFRFAAWDNRFSVAARSTIIVATMVFYGYENWLWCILFAVVITGIYAISLPVWFFQNPTIRRLGVVAAILYAVCALSIFKYVNWLVGFCPFLRPVQELLLPYFGRDGAIVLPPGISFYVFEALSFTIDAYRGHFRKRVRLVDYLTFLAMFPRFIAGPIVRYGDVSEQLEKWSGPRFSDGLCIFSLGFVIKILFADQFAVFVPYGFGSHAPDLLQAWGGAAAYTFQLYFDFWGYSLMAIGLGLCLGFAFPDNFRSPYRAIGISDFWRRWHITLSTWLRDYLYISLGGNRKSPWRVNLNLVITMAVAGIWHGAGLTFIVWGLYHGLLLAAEHMVGEKRLRYVPTRARQTVTFLLVLVGWVLFRSDSFDQAVRVLQGMCGLNGMAGQFNPLLLQKNLPACLFILVAAFFFFFLEPRIVGREAMASRTFSLRTQYLILSLFTVSLVFTISSHEIPFLYFQF